MQFTLDFTLLINGLVAIGTLALAGLTYYQLRQFVRDRRASVKRELDDRIYTPLRNELTSWLSPDEMYLDPTAAVWKTIKANTPYLATKIPPDLRDNMNKIQNLADRMNFLNRILRSRVAEELQRIAGKGNQPAIRIMVNGGVIEYVRDPQVAWILGKTITELSKNEIAKRYPVENWEKNWEVVVTFGDNRLGGTRETEEFFVKLNKFIEPSSDAQELHNKAVEIWALGKSTLVMIDQELGKTFAPLN